jgi:cytochrome c553
MNELAKSLTEEEMQALGECFAAQPAKTHSSGFDKYPLKNVLL